MNTQFDQRRLVLLLLHKAETYRAGYCALRRAAEACQQMIVRQQGVVYSDPVGTDRPIPARESQRSRRIQYKEMYFRCTIIERVLKSITSAFSLTDLPLITKHI